MTARQSGADVLCDELERAGVRCVFGLPGTQTVGAYEALRRSRLRAVVPSHELAAAFMASGFARATGRPGVLLTIPGPGFAYALAGLAEASLDATALVHITLSPAVGPTGTPAFQALDQCAIVRPLVKATLLVTAPHSLRATIRQALALAAEADPGPVYVEISDAVLRAESIDSTEPPQSTARTGSVPSAEDARAQDAMRNLAAVADAVSAARRPLLFVASDCTNDAGLLTALSERARVPVCVPPPSRGVVSEDHPWSLCFDDQRTRAEVLNELLAESDCIVVLGSRLGHVSTAGFRLALPTDRVVCVTAGSDGLPHGYAARLLARAAPHALLESLGERAATFASTWTREAAAAWQKRFANEQPHDLPEPTIDGAIASRFFTELRSALPDDAIVVTDSGLHQLLTRRHFTVRAPGGLLFPSDLQSMGFGVPAAIGATLAEPRRAVVAIVGDGGLLMSGYDLLTASREALPTIVIVFNDGQLNLIRMQQLREFGRAHGVALQRPDLEAFAKAAGVRYRRIAGDLPAAIREALALSSPVLLDVAVGDSNAVHRLHATSLARETMRAALGPGLVSWIKRRLRP